MQQNALPLSAVQGSVDALRLPKFVLASRPYSKWLYVSYKGFFFLETLVSSPEQLHELVLQHAVAFAGVDFEPLTVEDR